jgi:thioredoxin 1
MAQDNLVAWKGDKKALSDYVAKSSSKAVVAEFGASWCPSCRRLAALLPKLAKDYPNVMFLKIDTEEASELASDYSIQSIPQSFVFRGGDGELGDQGSVMGANPQQIKAKLDALLKG